jgi:PAS domain S-box-containing protein
MSDEPAASFSSGAALFVFDENLRILCWNEGAEALTGVASQDAVGRPCWEVVAGVDDCGNMVCHRGCSRARLVREGRCLPAAELHMRTATGRRRLALETIAAAGRSGTLFVHVMRDMPARPRQPVEPAPRLTPRQREILYLLAAGHPVKTIAHRLGLMETTVRNHIRRLFAELGAHSQLEAVARARALELV